MKTEEIDNFKKMEGKQFQHKNGNIYTVLFLANTDANPENMEKYPITVVYIGQNGKIWSRFLSDWNRSFSECIFNKNDNEPII